MKLKHLIINDLYSFGQGVPCVFSQNGSKSKTLIVGMNNDEAGADSNGAGKSNILNVIFWTIFGEIFQKENADDVIRRGQKSGSATLTLEDEKGSELVISRGRGSGAKKFLKLTYNGEDKTCTTDEKTQTELLRLLNISPSLKPTEYVNDFINTCYFSSDTVKGFMAKETKSKDRFAIIERFLGLKRYTLASNNAKKKKEEILTKIDTVLEDIATKENFLNEESDESIQTEIKALQGQAQEIENRIQQGEEEIEKNKEYILLKELIPQKNSALESKRNAVLQQLSSLESEHAQNKKTLAEIQKQSDEYLELKNKVAQMSIDAEHSSKVLAELEQQGNQINAELLQLNGELSLIDSNSQNIKGQMEDHYKCPNCNKELMLKDSKLELVDIDQLALELAKVQTQRGNLSETLEKKTEELAKISADSQKHLKVTQEYTFHAQGLNGRKTSEVLKDEAAILTERNTVILKEHSAVGKQAEQDIQGLKAEIAELTQKLESMGAPTVDVTECRGRIQEDKNILQLTHQKIGQCHQKLETRKRTEQELVDLKKKVESEKKEADIYGFWETGFRQIKINIIDEFLPDFEDRVNDYLNRLKVNMRVDFDTQKQKAKVSKKDRELGRVFKEKEEFNVEVYKGDTLLPYNLLSKGQRGRVGSCVGMALRELTKERGNNIFDFFFMDEIADALDESGLRELVYLLDEVDGQKLIISHNDQLKNYFEDIITVEMTNETSTIH